MKKTKNSNGAHAPKEKTNDQILAALRIKVRELDQSLRGGREEDGCMSADPVDRSTQSAATVADLATKMAETKTLLMVRVAIEKVQNGEYGICEDCEEQIAEKRLVAIPWAKLCVNCQDAKDRGADRVPVQTINWEEAEAI